MNKTLREVCAELGISRRTVQGYEKLGLVAPAGRNKYGHLLYDVTGQRRMEVIRFYQQIGCPLKEIKGILDAPNDIKKAALQARVEALETEHRQLQQLICRAKQHIAAL